MRITLAIPTNRGVRPKTVQALLDLVAYSKAHDFHIVVAEKGYTVAENRNYIVVQAKRNNSDYVLFVDDDMVFPPETLEMLLATGKDIVGVASNSRCLPPSPTVGQMDENGNYKDPDRHSPRQMQLPKELFEAYFVGGGVLLVNMGVFTQLPAPWFRFETDENGMVTTGEDGYFCKTAREHHIGVWCEPRIPIGHLGEYQY